MEESKPTLVLPPRYTQDSNALWKAAIRAGWDVCRLMSWRASDELAKRDVVLYGEPLFAATVADQLGLVLLEPSFDWLPRLRESFRKRKVAIATLGEAREMPGPAFFKPADDKIFKSKVYSSGADLPKDEVLPASTPVLVAEPVRWSVEFRCCVLEGRMETLSPYLRDGALVETDEGEWPALPGETEAATAFARSVLSTISVPPAVVLDVGIIEGLGWAVVEANPAWGSGIYGCDPDRVLPVIRRACIKKDRLSDLDRRWVIER